MNKIKSIFGCIGVTILIWTIARFAPGVVAAIFPDSAAARLISFVVFLPLGWAAAKGVSKGKHTRCIRANLYIFAFLEFSGMFTAITYLLQSLSLSTGRYRTDAYGVPYSDYFMIYGMVLIFEIIYVVLCFVLAKKTAYAKQTTIPIEPVITEKNHEKKQELRNHIAKLKNDLKESDKSYAENKKILSEAFSDEELTRMVTNGEFPADRVEEYKEQRRSLEMIISFMPTARETMVKHIGDLTKELAELECE